jgi:hypothetical protein
MMGVQVYPKVEIIAAIHQILKEGKIVEAGNNK